MNPKTCPRCGLTLPNADFYRDASKRDGLYSFCKPCEVARIHTYNQTHATAIRAQKRAYRASRLVAAHPNPKPPLDVS